MAVIPTFQFDVITHNGKLYSGHAQSIMIPGEKGLFGVLANHAALISTCVPGKLKIREASGHELFFETSEGFFEVAKNQAVFLVGSAQPL